MSGTFRTGNQSPFIISLKHQDHRIEESEHRGYAIHLHPHAPRPGRVKSKPEDRVSNAKELIVQEQKINK